jgi:molecular chaperone DnaK (HSP70)
MYFRHDYQQEINRIKQKNLNDDFDIDDLIEKVKQIPIIKIQLEYARNISRNTFISTTIISLTNIKIITRQKLFT